MADQPGENGEEVEKNKMNGEAYMPVVDNDIAKKYLPYDEYLKVCEVETII